MNTGYPGRDRWPADFRPGDAGAEEIQREYELELDRVRIEWKRHETAFLVALLKATAGTLFVCLVIAAAVLAIAWGLATFSEPFLEAAGVPAPVITETPVAP